MGEKKTAAGAWTLITDRRSPFTKGERSYDVVVEGLQRSDGTWAGRIVFRDGAQSLRTGQETSQPNRAALEYWATGLETVYLEGAFARAREGLAPPPAEPA